MWSLQVVPISLRFSAVAHGVMSDLSACANSIESEEALLHITRSLSSAVEHIIASDSALLPMAFELVLFYIAQSLNERSYIYL